MIARYTTKEITGIWSDENRFALWMKVELLALRALEKLGLAPTGKADVIEKNVTINPERVTEIEATVKHDIIAFLTHVSEQVGEDARAMHRGMTSNDLIDTTYALQMRQSGALLLAALRSLKFATLAKAEEHKKTVCIGRSHGMHAEPTTFGLKLLGFFAELSRAEKRISAALEEVCVGKIAGPVGTYASIPPEVERDVLAALGLSVEAVPTQVVARDRHAAFFSALAILGGSIERFATEIRHLQRSEVAEAAEPFTAGQKGSSAMPHKRNPILSENLTGLARLLRGYQVSAMENIALWHERDISHSSVERVITPDACNVAHFMLQRFTSVIEGLQVDSAKMLENINLTGGAVFSGPVLLGLVDKGMKREDAYAVVQKSALAAMDTKRKFADVLAEDPKIKGVLSQQEVTSLASTAPHIKHVDYIFERTKREYPS